MNEQIEEKGPAHVDSADVFAKLGTGWQNLFKKNCPQQDYLRLPFLDFMCSFFWYMDSRNQLGAVTAWDDDPLACFLVVFRPFDEKRLLKEMNESICTSFHKRASIPVSIKAYLAYKPKINFRPFGNLNSPEIALNARVEFLKKHKTCKNAAPFLKGVYDDLNSRYNHFEIGNQYKYDVLRFRCHKFRANMLNEIAAMSPGAALIIKQNVKSFCSDILASDRCLREFESQKGRGYVSNTRLFMRSDDFLYSGYSAESTQPKYVQEYDPNSLEQLKKGFPLTFKSFVLDYVGYTKPMKSAEQSVNALGMIDYC